MKFKPGDVIKSESGRVYEVNEIHDSVYILCSKKRYYIMQMDKVEELYELLPICKSKVWKALKEI
jgi:hypothetical protein